MPICNIDPDDMRFACLPQTYFEPDMLGVRPRCGYWSTDTFPSEEVFVASMLSTLLARMEVPF